MNKSHPISRNDAATARIEQEKLLRGLRYPQCYPHEVGQIERLETHISTVLLAGDFAYKIKKPVNLGFLDFTTLALRRHYCEEELRLNRRHAPSLYLDVVSIVGRPSVPRIAPHNAPLAIEYAVKMRRFPQSALLDRMLSSGELTTRHVDLMAEAVADFHCVIAESADRIGEYGTAAAIAAPMRQNFSQIRAMLNSDEEIAALHRLETWSVAAHNRLAALMERRKRAGFVRECHGDLHLGNIAWVDSQVQLFDCIEFNPELRWIDVANEIAFTVMDLSARGHPEWGARFLNEYLELTGDYEALLLLPYYLVYRAIVRAKIARIRAMQTHDERQRAALDDYREHIALAERFTAPRAPALMITHGVAGTGKTTASQPLVEQLGALRLRSDVVRKRLYGLPRGARSDSALPGLNLYSDMASLATYAELRRLATLTIGAGYPVIVDATFLSRGQRLAMHALAAESGVPFLIVDCHADPEELRRRVAQRELEGKDASEATLAVLERQLLGDEPPAEDESDNVVVIDTQHLLQDDIVARVSQHLQPREPWIEA